MDLTGEFIEWIAIALIAIALIGGGWLTSRTPRRWTGALLNAVLLLLASVLVSLAILLVVNKQFVWYASTADLFTTVATTSDTAGASDPFSSAKVNRVDSRSLPPLASGTQRTFEVKVPTSTGGRQWPVTIVLPADYFEPGSANVAYPVLFAGHGQPGGMGQWLKSYDIGALRDASVAAGAVRPFIAVIPTLSPTGSDNECIFGPDGDRQLESWLASDLPTWVAQHLRVIPEREGWAWMGFSAGAWCGSMVTMLHPERFAGAISLGGYFKAWWGAAPPAGVRNDPRYDLVRVAKEQAPPVALWVQTSVRDKTSHPSSAALKGAVRTPTSLVLVVDQSGGHTLAAWQPHLAPALAWLGRTLPGFQPA